MKSCCQMPWWTAAGTNSWRGGLKTGPVNYYNSPHIWAITVCFRWWTCSVSLTVLLLKLCKIKSAAVQRALLLRSPEQRLYLLPGAQTIFLQHLIRTLEWSDDSECRGQRCITVLFDLLLLWKKKHWCTWRWPQAGWIQQAWPQTVAPAASLWWYLQPCEVTQVTRVAQQGLLHLPAPFQECGGERWAVTWGSS